MSNELGAVGNLALDLHRRQSLERAIEEKRDEDAQLQ